ncbi:hypothetical protein [Actinomadura macrotermitis]|uniref:Uncharacterized protein n=1 Tax=Actinomadura macrotermitis TaxID=2585200 RepID=A0A7K0BWV4_9ACTN|nr:hypothetical protein [Actinomadura macrotermitis]MQY05648.1 hypothetical protein [Actinomadura macrotermitis]
MTVILILLCLAIAGRELYLAFDRKRSGGGPEVALLRRRVAGTAEEVARLRRAQDKQATALTETDGRIASLVTQINDRVVPQVNQGLGAHRAALDRLEGEVAAIRAQLAGRLDQAVAASLGADPVDTVVGALAADDEEVRAELGRAYERFAGACGLRVEMVVPVEEEPWRVRYYLSGRSPRALERDFIELLRAPGAEARALLEALRGVGQGGAQVGPLVMVRTPDALVCGVLTLARLRCGADPLADPDGLRRLPESRLLDATALSA